MSKKKPNRKLVEEKLREATTRYELYSNTDLILKAFTDIIVKQSIKCSITIVTVELLLMKYLDTL